MKILFCCCVFVAAACAQTLTPVWLELGPAGAVLARVVVEARTPCPALEANRKPLAMTLRQPLPAGLKPVCETLIPAGTRSLRYGKKQIRLPKTPDRIAVVGDTGCRVKGGQIQACNDPSLWPFQRVSEQVAKLKPDLIVHVGDYLYRESVCPAMVPGCNGPHGDNWEAWNADFFQPAQAALSAAPWVFARGNHEDCGRSFRGWFYYLDPRPYEKLARTTDSRSAPKSAEVPLSSGGAESRPVLAFEESCREYTEPYVAQSGTLRLGVLDSASTKDLPNAEPKQIPIYSKQLRELSGRADWLVDHHPFWGYTVNKGAVSPTELTLGPAWEDAKPQGIGMVLSGHVHLFEFLALEDGRPNQLIAGDSGTELDVGFTFDRSGSSVNGARVKAGDVSMSFGLTKIERGKSGWTLSLLNAAGTTMIACALPTGNPASCKSVH